MAPVRDRARSRAVGEEAPNRVISPAVGWDWPEMSRMRVVLPAPFRPTRPKICPFSMDRSAWSRARVRPYRRVRPRVCNTNSEGTVGFSTVPSIGEKG